MPDPVQFTLRRTGDLWRLERDGADQGAYSHLDQATHDAVGRARLLQEGGSPASVSVILDDGRRVEVDVEPAAPPPELADGARDFTPDRPL